MRETTDQSTDQERREYPKNGQVRGTTGEAQPRILYPYTDGKERRLLQEGVTDAKSGGKVRWTERPASENFDHRAVTSM